MRAFSRLVFDDYLVGTTAIFTSDAFSDLLGSTGQLAIQIVATNISGTSPSLIVRIQSSHDGRRWSYKSATPEIDTRSITPGGTSVEVGTDRGTTPSLARVRLQIALAGTNPGAHLKVWVCGRASRRSQVIAARAITEREMPTLRAPTFPRSLPDPADDESTRRRALSGDPGVPTVPGRRAFSVANTPKSLMGLGKR